MTAVEIAIPEKLQGLFQPRQFKILHGGRGGGKSHGVAQWLILEALSKQHRILCLREVQKSIAQSSMQVIKDYISSLGVSRYFEILKTEIRCLLTGSTFSFSGLRDHTADSIKSFEGATRVWIEEAHSVSAHSWNILVPTIVRTNGAEIVATFNPDQITDYVYDRFVSNVDADAWVQQIGWQDNKWMNEAMHLERRKLRAINDDLYRHVWEGECRSAAGIMFKREWFRWYDQLPESLNLYMASDYAVTPDGGDFTEHGVGGLDHLGHLYLAAWWYGQTDPSVWIGAAVNLLRENKPHIWFEEAGVILRSQDSAIAKTITEVRPPIYIQRQALPSAGNKASRAMGFAARASMGTVWLPRNEPWAERLVNQLCAFTGEPGKTDDGVDVCSLLARGLDEMGDAGLPERPKSTTVTPFTEAWMNQHDQDDDEPQRKRFYG